LVPAIANPGADFSAGLFLSQMYTSFRKAADVLPSWKRLPLIEQRN
jgi:hypothetical protein